MPQATQQNSLKTGRLDELTAMQKVLTSPFADRIISVVSNSVSIEEADKFAGRVKEAFMSIPKLILSSAETSSKYVLMEDTEESEQKIQEAGREMAIGAATTMQRLPTALQMTLFPKDDKSRVESAINGFLLPEEVPAGYLGGEIAKKLNPDLWVAAGLIGAATEIMTYDIAFGNFGRRLSAGYKARKLQGATDEANKFIDYLAPKLTNELESKGFFPKEWNQADKIGRTKAFLQQNLEMNTDFGNFLLSRQTPSKVLFKNKIYSKSGQLLFQPENTPLKSNLKAVAFAKLPNFVKSAQAINTLLNSGISKEEIEFSGVENFLKGKDKVSKEELLDYIEKNKVKVEPIVKGGVERRDLEMVMDVDDQYLWHIKDKNGKILHSGSESNMSELIDSYHEGKGSTKYSQYTLPGGENYLETALTIPIKGYKQPHDFPEGTVVEHRTNQRTDAQGNKGTFVEEIQSDWHREGKQKGYNVEQKKPSYEELEKKLRETDRYVYFSFGEYVVVNREGQIVSQFGRKTKNEVLDDFYNNYMKPKPTGIPNAPFKNTWHELALKDIIRQAVERGDKFVAFISGEQTASRYDLSKQVDSISYKKVGDKYDIRIAVKGTPDGLFQELKSDEIDNFVGKEVGEKIRTGYGKKVANDFIRLENVDLKVGGEWAKKFYDEIMPRTAQKYISKWGGKIEDIEVPSVPTNKYSGEIKPDRKNKLSPVLKKQKGFYITLQMAKEVKEIGQPMFGNRLAGGIFDKLKEKRGTAGVEGKEELPDDWDKDWEPTPEIFNEMKRLQSLSAIEKKALLKEKMSDVEMAKEYLEELKAEMKNYKNRIGRYKGGYLSEEYNEIPIYFRKKGGLSLDKIGKEAGFESEEEFRKYLINLYNSVKQAELDLVRAKMEKKIVADDLRDDPPKFEELVGDEFLKQPKKNVMMTEYFTPAEYHLKHLGFDKEIGSPVREALMNFNMELAKKVELIQSAQYDQQKNVKKKDIKSSNLIIFNMLDKGIKAPSGSIEEQIAMKYRKETEDILERMNEVRKMMGQAPIKSINNYILHMLRPEILNEIYARGVIPPELAKVMDYIPTKKVFLRTAIERQGVPEEWLVKDPHELMKAMFAIDLRYIYLQKAFVKIDPYLKAVKDYIGPEGDYWPPETYKYLDKWVKEAVKMRPSYNDEIINNLFEFLFAPTLRKAGLRVSHMPWRDFVNFYSNAMHVGVMGMRIRPILRNFVQSTFDWVMYGTKYYLKGSNEFNKIILGKGDDVLSLLNKSSVWRTRLPFEAQDKGGLGKIFRAGSIGYRLSDIHNVGKGLLTRYYYAKDYLKMSDEDAMKFADDDLPGTQWSYQRVDLPRAYWTTTGRFFWTLGSWWQNYYFRFLPEIVSKTFYGVTADGRKVSSVERMAGIRFIILIGALFAIREASEELTGTVIDYLGQIKPTPFRESPLVKSMFAIRDIAQGMTDNDDRLFKSGMRELSNSLKLTLPFYLGIKDVFDLINNDKKLGEVLFYNGGKKKKWTIK